MFLDSTDKEITSFDCHTKQMLKKELIAQSTFESSCITSPQQALLTAVTGDNKHVSERVHKVTLRSDMASRSTTTFTVSFT